jgi:hypothetical protein
MMMQRRKRRWLLLLLGLSSFSSASTVQAHRNIPADGFQIRNRSNRPIKFWLGKGSDQWAIYQLGAGECKSYEGWDRIWMTLPGQYPLHHRLAAGETYALVPQADTRLKRG